VKLDREVLLNGSFERIVD